MTWKTSLSVRVVQHGGTSAGDPDWYPVKSAYWIARRSHASAVTEKSEIGLSGARLGRVSENSLNLRENSLNWSKVRENSLNWGEGARIHAACGAEANGGILSARPCASAADGAPLQVQPACVGRHSPAHAHGTGAVARVRRPTWPAEGGGASGASLHVHRAAEAAHGTTLHLQDRAVGGSRHDPA